MAMTVAIITPNFTGAVARPLKKSAHAPNLAGLIADLVSAIAETDKWCTIEDNLDYEFRKVAPPHPKVLGGTTPAKKLVIVGELDMDIPASDWFYHSREDIEKARDKGLANAKTDEDRAVIEARAAERLAEFDRQEKARESAMPSKLREAKRKLGKAHDAWTRAEQAIANYKPKDAGEAVELLECVTADKRGIYFQGDEEALRAIICNAADALRNAVDR